MAAFVLALVSVTLASRMLVADARQSATTTIAQAQMLRWSHDALRSFASMHGRLPCPAGGRLDEEDCNLTKGWLPLRTLEEVMDAEIPFDQGANISYGIYRGTGDPGDPDLGAVAEMYVPLVVGGEPARDYKGVPSGFDLCRRLQRTSPGKGSMSWDVDASALAAGRLDRLHVVVGGVLKNPSYAIAVAKDAGAAGASGVNTISSSLAFESPDRATSATYADLVGLAYPASLYEALGCTDLLASVDAMAVSAEFIEAVTLVRDANAYAAETAAPYQSLFSASSAFGAVAASIDLADGIFKLQANIAGVPIANAAIASGVPADVVWGLQALPKYTSGIASGKKTLILNSTDIPRNVAGAIVDGVYLGSYVKATEEANKTPWWAGSRALLQAVDRAGLSLPQRDTTEESPP